MAASADFKNYFSLNQDSPNIFFFLLLLQIRRWGIILVKAENVLTVELFQHLFGGGTERAIIYVMLAVSITR